MGIREDLYTAQHCTVRISTRVGDGGQGRSLGIVSECQSPGWASHRSWCGVEHGTYRGAKEECSPRL